MNKHEQAVASLKQSIAIDSTNSDAWFDLGRAHTGLSQYEEARIAYTAALDQESELIPALINRAYVNLRLNQPAAAKEDAIAATELDPLSWAGFVNLADSCAQLGEHGKAALNYSILLGMANADDDKANAQTLRDFTVGRGDAYLNRGEYEKAANDYRTALKLSETGNTHHALGHCLLQLGKLDEAIKHTSTAIDTSPQPRSFRTRGRAYRLLGRFTKAAADFETSLKTEPDSLMGLVNLALIRVASPHDGDRDPSAAEQLCDKLAGQLSDNIEVSALRSLIAAQKDDSITVARSLESLRELTEASKEPVPLWIKEAIAMLETGSPFRLKARP